MLKRRTGRVNSIIIIVVCLVSIVLVGSSFAMLAEYSTVINDGAGIIGLINCNEAADNFKSSIQAYKDKAEKYAKELLLEPASDSDMFSLNAARLSKDDRFSEVMFIRYFKDGKEYNLSNNEYDTSNESRQVVAGARMDVPICVGVIEDRQYSISAMAYCIPLKNCPFADNIVLFFPVGSVVDATEVLDDTINKSQITSICSSAGEMVSILYNSGFEVEQHNNVYEFLRKKINDKGTIDDVQAVISEGGAAYYTVKISGHENILAVSGIREHGTSPFSVIALYRADDIYSSAYSTVSTVLGELAVFFVMLIFVAIYFIISYRASEKRIKNIKEYNETLDCPTQIKFERVSAEILSQNKGTNFAVVVVDIKHFDYLVEQMGYEQMVTQLKQIRDFYIRFLQVQETYGYVNNGRFLLLFHYRDVEALGARIKMLSANMSISKITNAGERINFSVYGGICLSEGGALTSVDKMIDRAILAENATKYAFDFESFRLYNESLHSSNAMNEYIEVNMQNALDNKLFKIFYQPKFNLEGNRPDGCEALVRWYNPETDEYMTPAVFLPLFEENGFIVKLDKYVYEQVCVYIADTVNQHKQLYPISVNVSRITASRSDFVRDYIAIKEKYNIADNFITIEFTESFAFEDYERLRDTVNTLHKSGFNCSIDDFGSGFSSYNILKELPMDEIKLDKFFIDKGFSDERDFKVLSSVIRLGRELNMKVTQEGVETKDQLIMLKKLGCNVIQGYYYSKPLVQGDYDDFLTRKDIINILT